MLYFWLDNLHSLKFLCPIYIVLFLFVCGQVPDQKDKVKMQHDYNTEYNKEKLNSYHDSCVQAAKVWLDINGLTNLINRFEIEQKEQTEIDHSLNYSLGNFNVAKISSSPLKFSVTYSNKSTNATFLISWIVDFSVHRVYANPNKYGYDREGVPF